MKTIYLIRHCQAFGQEMDANLTEIGVKQSVELAEFFSTKNIDQIIASPFKRAVDSVVPLANMKKLRIVKDTRLTERVLSTTDQPEWFDMLRRTFDDIDLCFDGGESSRKAAKRAIDVIAEIVEGPYDTTVVATHGNLLSLILNYFDNKYSFETWRDLTNPDVYQLDFDTNSINIKRIWK